MDLERRYRQLLERHGNGDLDRRGFLGNIGRMALACGVVAPTFMTFARSAHAGETIRYDGFGGYAQEAFDRLVLKPFTQKTGITVIQGSYANPDAMLAQIQCAQRERIDDRGSPLQGGAFHRARRAGKKGQNNGRDDEKRS